MPEIVLYTAQTPNGTKVSILLEELGYDFHYPSLVYYGLTPRKPPV